MTTIQAGNFNDATAGKVFEIPDQNWEGQTQAELGFPGFVVLKDGQPAKWFINITEARADAGNDGGVFQAWEVYPYFRQFAREETILPDGTEEDAGPLK